MVPFLTLQSKYSLPFTGGLKAGYILQVIPGEIESLNIQDKTKKNPIKLSNQSQFIPCSKGFCALNTAHFFYIYDSDFHLPAINHQNVSNTMTGRIAHSDKLWQGYLSIQIRETNCRSRPHGCQYVDSKRKGRKSKKQQEQRHHRV